MRNRANDKAYLNLLQEFQKKIGYRFRDNNLLVLALTHKSYTSTLPENSTVENNERCEFLGDSVLGLAVAESIYKTFPKKQEGEMSELRSKIVCKTNLAHIAGELNIYRYLRYGKVISEEEIKKNESIAEDVMESLIGAIYLDSNLKYAKRFIFKFITNRLEEIELSDLKDSKTKLQEELQALSSANIEYVVASEDGPDHDKTFRVDVYNNGEKLGSGMGKNKKEAEKEAASQALAKI